MNDNGDWPAIQGRMTELLEAGAAQREALRWLMEQIGKQKGAAAELQGVFALMLTAEGVRNAHRAIDTLLAAMALYDPTFKPSGSPAWAAVQQGHAAMQAAEARLEPAKDDPFVCPRCGFVSHSKADKLNNYCGRCHGFFNEAGHV